MQYLHLTDVLSRDQCADIILHASERGFERAPILSHGQVQLRPEVRNNSRILWQDSGLAVQLEQSLFMKAGPAFPPHFGSRQFLRLGDGFRVYRYLPGEYFKPHRDGSQRQEGAESLVTMLVYLNDTNGGETVLMPDGFLSKGSWLKVSPRAGDVLMFAHDVWHEGRPVLSGEKYVLRTDLFYRRE